MPTRQETMWKYFQNSKKRKIDENAGKEDDNKVDDELPSTSRSAAKRVHIHSLEDVLNRPTREADLRVKHHVLPNFNRTRIPPGFNELQNYPNCQISLPHPVHVADKHCEVVDPCHRRVMARETYTNRLSHARTAYLNATKNNKKLRALEKKNQYHYSLFEFAERLEMDPDPFFNSPFDFYYTGGNLCVLDSNYVVHVGGKNLQELYISRFANKKDMANSPLRQLHCETLPHPGDIMEVMPFKSNRESRPNCFVTRQRNTVSLYSYSCEEKLKPISQYNNKSTPFISFAQSAVNPNNFILTNMKQHVRLYDLNASRTTLLQLYELGEDDKDIEWNIVRPWREHTFLYANTKEMLLMDLRTSPKEWNKTKCGIGEDDLVCENISIIMPSEFKKQIYVGTSHKLYCLDSRCWGAEFEGPSATCIWQHQLEHPPLLLETYRHFSSEFVFLSSPMADDLRVCELIRAGRVDKEAVYEFEIGDEPLPKYHYKSLSLPFQPPTLHEAYENARLNGKCLRPYSNLQKRLNCATTGLAFYVHPEGKLEQTLLLTANSNGDVFAHQFDQRETQEEEPRTTTYTDSVIAKYDDTISQLSQPDLNFTKVDDMSAMSRVLRCATLSCVKTEIEFEKSDDDDDDDDDDPKKTLPRHSKRRRLGRWQKSMQTLHSFKDALVPSLLSIWDIDFSAENDIKIAELDKKLRIKPDPETMVNSWLDRMQTTSPPMTSIPAAALNSSVATELNLSTTLMEELNAIEFSESLLDAPHSTQVLDVSTVSQNDATLVSEQPSTTAQLDTTDRNTTMNKDAKQRPQTKKKRSYVKGF